MFSGSTPRPMIAGVVFLLFFIYPAGSNDDKASVNPGELRTRRAAQTFLREIQIQYLWMWVDYLRWKFKLPSTNLGRVGLNSMVATTEEVVLGVWLSNYYASHLKLEDRGGVDWIISGCVLVDLQHLLKQLNVSRTRGIIVQEKYDAVSSILSTNAFSRLLCSQLKEWSMDDSEVFILDCCQLIQKNTKILIHVSTAYGAYCQTTLVRLPENFLI